MALPSPSFEPLLFLDESGPSGLRAITLRAEASAIADKADLKVLLYAGPTPQGPLELRLNQTYPVPGRVPLWDRVHRSMVDEFAKPRWLGFAGSLRVIFRSEGDPFTTYSSVTRQISRSEPSSDVDLLESARAEANQALDRTYLQAINRAYHDGLAEAVLALNETAADLDLGQNVPDSRYKTAWTELRGRLERRLDAPPPQEIVDRARRSFGASEIGTSSVKRGRKVGAPAAAAPADTRSYAQRFAALAEQMDAAGEASVSFGAPCVTCEGTGVLKPGNAGMPNGEGGFCCIPCHGTGFPEVLRSLGVDVLSPQEIVDRAHTLFSSPSKES